MAGEIMTVKRDDITAIASRIDAQTVVIIELIAEAHDMDTKTTRKKYTKEYDRLAEKYRNGMLR
jgi:hypothetical protein